MQPQLLLASGQSQPVPVANNCCHCRRAHGKKVVRCLQERLDAAAAQSACAPESFEANGQVRHSFTNPTWSPESTSALPSPCSSLHAQASTRAEAPQSIWETLQGPWDPSPSWWFSPLESHLEQGNGGHQLAGIPSGITEAESIEPLSLPRHGPHPALSEPALPERPLLAGAAVCQGPPPADHIQGLPAHGIKQQQQQQPQQLCADPACVVATSPTRPSGRHPSDVFHTDKADGDAPYDPFHIRMACPDAIRDALQAVSSALPPVETQVPHAGHILTSSCVSSSSGSYRSARSSSHLSSMLGAGCFSGRRQASHHRPLATPAWTSEPAQPLAPPEESISPEALRPRRSLSPIGSRRQKHAGLDCTKSPGGFPNMPAWADSTDKARQARSQHDSQEVSDGKISQHSSSDPSQASASTSFSLQLSHQHTLTSAQQQQRQQHHHANISLGGASVPMTIAAPHAADQTTPSLSLLEMLRHHGGPLPEALTWTAIEEAARALQSIHDAGLVHGAVSLETISLESPAKARYGGCPTCSNVFPCIPGKGRLPGLICWRIYD